MDKSACRDHSVPCTNAITVTKRCVVYDAIGAQYYSRRLNYKRRFSINYLKTIEHTNTTQDSSQKRTLTSFMLIYTLTRIVLPQSFHPRHPRRFINNNYVFQ